ncbi:MAG: SDR family oxidoreductase [Gammaproteobacteria bacterium]|nr:SDR family oxidoreductase [Gammaproteobacteria bacterium]MCP5201268.1 SDR family oxidoreductase [Gammaproteobacteria bacterium]
MTRQCQDKVALVTGGASGIGRASAVALAGAGATVMVADRNHDGCEETVELIRAAGGSAAVHAVDVASETEVERLVAETVATFGRLDLAFNNAGVGGTFAKTADYPSDDWDRVIAVNLTGVWYCMKHEIRYMLDHGGGAIVNTASVAGLVGMGAAPAYTAAKHGVVGLTRNAALEYARNGIRINAVCPGLVRTGMTEGAEAAMPGFFDRLAKQEPVGRVAEPEEIASAVVWLLSDGASYMTGHALAVDGGYVAR